MLFNISYKNAKKIAINHKGTITMDKHEEDWRVLQTTS